MVEPSGRARLAYCSPLPPQATGIADYSAELLPRLADRFEIELFTSRGCRPPRELAKRFPVRRLATLSDARGFDAVVYHVGNNVAMHRQIYETALEVPGIVVLHEFMLHHLIRDLSFERGEYEYLEQMRHCYGAGGYTTGKRFLKLGAARDLWAYPMFERIVDRSLGIVVHNETARRRIAASRPAARVEVVPHFLPGSPGPELRDAVTLRRDLGLPERGLLVASFGFLSEAKRLEVALRAFARFRHQHSEACFLLVGDDRRHPGLPALLDSELGQCVIRTGRVSDQRFTDYMRATDLALNLRYPTGGESSGTLLRLMGLGKAVVVSDTGSFAELPEGCCARVAVDRDEEDQLLALLLTLADDPTLREELGRHARAYVEREHSMARCLDRWTEAILGIAEAKGVPTQPVPPLAPMEPGDIASRLIDVVAAGLEDLGVAGEDDELVDGIARKLIDLRLN